MIEAEFIDIVEEYDHPRAVVWRALTNSDALSRWLMPNDFKLEIGHRFTFEALPIPAVGFNGTVHCQVLAFEVERNLSISWSDGLPAGADWTVTWSLEDWGSGTRVRAFFHCGFEPNNERHQMSRRIMSGGWRPALGRLKDICAEIGIWN